MILQYNDAVYAANIFENFFSNFGRIDDYLRKVKLERMMDVPSSLPGMGPEEDLFNNFDMHPSEMEFSVFLVKQKDFMRYLQLVSSHVVESSIPGKELTLLVKEKNTNSIVGMLRLGSPTINSKPRNEWLGKPLNTTDKSVMKRFNDSCIMGFCIVPSQPFGYNYLGGKLLSGICCSHAIRRMVSEKYETKLCMFETTSLYGSSKSSSQYDGMKPFLRFNGLTDSNFTPSLNDDVYRNLNQWFTERNQETPLVTEGASSRKLKTQTKMISVIKSSLKKENQSEYEKFCKLIDKAKGLTERKRSFFSTYGYDNVKEYLNLETDELIKKDNFDRFELDNVIEWWRNKASKRYDTLKSEGRLRTKVETWNNNPDEIDIIR